MPRSTCLLTLWVFPWFGGCNLLVNAEVPENPPPPAAGAPAPLTAGELLLDLPLVSGSTRSSTGALRAGTGKADLLEGWSGPVQLATYGPLPGMAKGVREPVYARALVIENGGLRLAIVSCDLLIMDERLRRQALDRLVESGVVVDDFLLAATHTHTSIGGYVDNKMAAFYMLGKFQPAVREHLAARIAAAVAQAAASVQPARCGAARAFVEGLSFNRRLGSTIDPEVAILKLTDAAGKPLAVVVNFAAHPILEPADGLISSDYPGRLAKILDDRYGFGLFLGGALGDVNARVEGEKEEWRAPGLAEKEAARLAAAVDEAAAAAVDMKEVLELSSMTVSVELPAINVGLVPDILFPLDWLAGKAFDAPLAVPLQAMRIGDAAIIASATELSVRLGLQIKRRSPSPFPMVVTHANHYGSYAVEQVNHATRKLDPSSVIFLYGATYGRLIVEKACNLLEAQWGKKLDPAASLLSPAAAARLDKESRAHAASTPGEGLSSEAERAAQREAAVAREEEETFVRADTTLPQSRRFGGIVTDSLPETVRLEASFLYLEDLHGGDRIEGRRREAGARLRFRGPWDVRADLKSGYVRSEWEVAGKQDSTEGAADLVLGLERPFLLAASDVRGNGLRLIPRLEASAPAGDADSQAPFAFAAGAGVWRPAAGGALELTWETYRTFTLETSYQTSVDRYRGRRPGDRWESALGYSERHGIASIHLDFTAALQLPDRRSGGRLAVDVDETSFELGLRPGLSFHLGEHVELFAEGRIPLAHSGDGAGEGRGGLLGILVGF